MKLRNTLFIFCLLLFNQFLFAQELTGIWKTIDDKTNLPTAHIEIFKEGDVFHGKVVKMLRDDPSTLCKKCEGDLKNKPIMGMVILKNMKKDSHSEYSDGTILDPESGKEYSCNIDMKSELSLELRGYIGVPLFGRSQEWIKEK